MHFIAKIFIVLIILAVISIAGYFIYINYIDKKSSQSPQQSSSQTPQQSSTNVCNKGPQSKLMNYTCQDIISKKLNNTGSSLLHMMQDFRLQDAFMKDKGIDVAEFGFKFDGEDCWDESIQNCINNTCLNKNPKDMIICKLKYMFNYYDKFAVLYNPWVIKVISKYNITNSELGI